MSATQVPFALPVSVRNDGECVRSLVDAEGNIIALNSMVSKFSPAEDRDNLENIAACINNHAALVEAADRMAKAAETIAEIEVSLMDDVGVFRYESALAELDAATKAYREARKAGEGK